MPLDRKAVDETAGQHIRQLRESGQALTEKQRREIRRQHERVARMVEEQQRDLRHRKGPGPMHTGQHTARLRILHER